MTDVILVYNIVKAFLFIALHSDLNEIWKE